MKKSIGNILLLLCTFGVAMVLQVVAALAVMLPAMIIKQVQLINMGISNTQKEQEILLQMTQEMTGITVCFTHILLLVVFFFWYYFCCSKRQKITVTLKRTFRKTNIWKILLLAVACCYLTNFAMPLAAMIIPENIMQSYLELMEAAGFGNSILPTLTAVLIAPFGEELIFRGVMYHYAKGIVATIPDGKKAFYMANVIQALAFGIFHGNLVQASYAFLLGLMMGYVRERFGSILASILAHMAVNFVSTFLWTPVASQLPETIGMYIVGSLICAGIVVLGFRISGPALQEENVI